MVHTNIYLDQECHQYLQIQSQQLGKTISELVREMVRTNMNKDTKKILQATDGIYALWKDKQIEVDEYIREIRKDRMSYDHD